MNTLKKEIIKAFAGATDIDALRGNNIVLITATGMITGRLCDPDTPLEDMSGAAILNALVEQVTDAYGPENIEGNDGYIQLTDVVIRASGNTTYNVGNLIVFYDQIIGVSLGNPA